MDHRLGNIDLVNLASSKNFVDRLHNGSAFCLFSLDFVLAFSGLFFRFIYMATGFDCIIKTRQ